MSVLSKCQMEALFQAIYLHYPWLHVAHIDFKPLGLESDRLREKGFEDLYLKFQYFFTTLMQLLCVKQISVITERFVYYHVWAANALQQNKQTDCVNIYKSFTDIHECRNLKRGRACSFLGIFVSNFRCSACFTPRLLKRGS